MAENEMKFGGKIELIDLYLSRDIDQVLNVDTNLLKTYTDKQLTEDEKDTWTKILTMETCVDEASYLVEIGDFENAEDQLLEAEALSTKLMEEVNQMLKRNVVKKDVQKPEENIEVPDYGSKTTVGGIKEDVINVKVNVKKQFSQTSPQTPPPQAPPNNIEVTSKQISEIQRVTQANDDYDILGVPKGSQLKEVKKAYNKLAMVLHPDHNRAPGATEAFRKMKDARDRLKKLK